MAPLPEKTLYADAHGHRIYPQCSPSFQDCPERRYFIDKIAEHTNEYPRLYALRPGLFSNATLYNGYTDNMEKMLIRLKMDLEYLENRSLLTDIKIIAKTTYSIISGKTF